MAVTTNARRHGVCGAFWGSRPTAGDSLPHPQSTSWRMLIIRLCCCRDCQVCHARSLSILLQLATACGDCMTWRLTTTLAPCCMHGLSRIALKRSAMVCRAVTSGSCVLEVLVVIVKCGRDGRDDLGGLGGRGCGGPSSSSSSSSSSCFGRPPDWSCCHRPRSRPRHVSSSSSSFSSSSSSSSSFAVLRRPSPSSSSLSFVLRRSLFVCRPPSSLVAPRRPSPSPSPFALHPWSVVVRLSSFVLRLWSVLRLPSSFVGIVGVAVVAVAVAV